MAEDLVDIDLDGIISKLLEGEFKMLAVGIYIFLSLARGSRTMKTVQLAETEVKALCLKSREIFLDQPILLELEAPLKVCGKLKGVSSYYSPGYLICIIDLTTHLIELYV